jgi:phospholipase C
MGPQAIGGTLQLTPGTTLRVGYDFTLPGNNTSLTMTVRAAQVSFAVICVSKAVVPSVSTLTVPMRAQTYQITGSQWYPSGAQSSSLVYQGSISVPALCGPAGAISLATGGTFTAILR